MSVLIPSPTLGAGSAVTSLTGDVTASGPGAAAATIAAGAVTLAKEANLAANSLVGNNTGSPATPLALTTAQANTLLGTVTSLTGDVTASGPGASAATIAAGAVTLAKQANLAANSIIGNNTGSPATPLALTVAQIKTLLGIGPGATYAAFGSRPAAGTSGAMFFSSNSPIALWVDDGAAWHPLIQGQAVGTQPKAAASFTGLNVGSTTLVDNNGALNYSMPSGGGTTTLRGYVESLSSATAHVEAVLSPRSPNIAAGSTLVPFGICMRESSTGKMLTFMIEYDPANTVANFGTWFLERSLWSNNTTITSSADYDFINPNAPLFLRIRRSGSNMLCETSADNVNWNTVNSVATTTAFTTAPDQVGIVGVSWNNVETNNFDVLHYNSGT